MPEQRPDTTHHAIPVRLNLALALVVFLAALALLALAARQGFPWLLVVGLVYSFLLLTNYALLHEASHNLLHPDRRINDGIGMVLGWLFPISFTLLKVTHIVHHCCNRTDHEMFDCYYPGDNRLVKTIQWYGVLTGVWWLLIPLGSLLLALQPDWLRSPRSGRPAPPPCCSMTSVRRKYGGCAWRWRPGLASGFCSSPC